jgi:hypothetical protein
MVKVSKKPFSLQGNQRPVAAGLGMGTGTSGGSGLDQARYGTGGGGTRCWRRSGVGGAGTQSTVAARCAGSRWRGLGRRAQMAARCRQLVAGSGTTMVARCGQSVAGSGATTAARCRLRHDDGGVRKSGSLQHRLSSSR